MTATTLSAARIAPAAEPRRLRPARTFPERRDDVRLLVVDPTRRRVTQASFADLPGHLRAGDLLVVNDAATLPASLPATTSWGARSRLRLLQHLSTTRGWSAFRAVLFGAGDWRTRTEDRPPPPGLAVGAPLAVRGVAGGGDRGFAGERGGCSRCGSIAGETSCGRRCTGSASRCNTRTWRTSCRCGRCRPCTRHDPGRSRCRRRAGRSAGRSCSRCGGAGSRWRA